MPQKPVGVIDSISTLGRACEIAKYCGDFAEAKVALAQLKILHGILNEAVADQFVVEAEVKIADAMIKLFIHGKWDSSSMVAIYNVLDDIVSRGILEAMGERWETKATDVLHRLKVLSADAKRGKDVTREHGLMHKIFRILAEGDGVTYELLCSMYGVEPITAGVERMVEIVEQVTVNSRLLTLQPRPLTEDEQEDYKAVTWLTDRLKVLLWAVTQLRHVGSSCSDIVAEFRRKDGSGYDFPTSVSSERGVCYLFEIMVAYHSLSIDDASAEQEFDRADIWMARREYFLAQVLSGFVLLCDLSPEIIRDLGYEGSPLYKSWTQDIYASALKTAEAREAAQLAKA